MAIVLEGTLDRHKWTAAALGSLMMRLEVVVQMGAAAKARLAGSQLLHFRIQVRMGCDRRCTACYRRSMVTSDYSGMTFRRNATVVHTD